MDINNGYMEIIFTLMQGYKRLAGQQGLGGAGDSEGGRGPAGRDAAPGQAGVAPWQGGGRGQEPYCAVRGREPPSPGRREQEMVARKPHFAGVCRGLPSGVVRA